MDELDNETKRRLLGLLGGVRLSRAEIVGGGVGVLDEIARRVGMGNEKEKRPGQVIRYAGWGGAILAAAAAVLLFVKVPSGPGGDDVRVHVPEDGDLPARAVLEVRCSGGKLTACPRSSAIVFALKGKGARGFLSAYAEPVGHDGERVFYFSKEDGSAELGVGAEGARVTERAVRIAADQRAGRYRVHAFLAARPFTREEMQSGPGPGVIATARVEVVIVE